MNRSHPITRLPVETWLNISRFVKLEDLAAVSLTCHTLHQIIPLSECLQRQCQVDALIRSYPRQKARLFHYLNCKQPAEASSFLLKIFDDPVREPLMYEYLREHGDNVEPTEALAKRAIQKNSLRILDWLLPKMDIQQKSEELLLCACRSRNLDMLERLLQDPAIRPTEKSVSEATINSNKAAVGRLICDPRLALPAANWSMILAAALDQLSIVQLLLHDGRIDPATAKNAALIFAFLEGHADVVALLLHQPRVNPAAITAQLIHEAIDRGRMDAVRVLLMHPRVHVSISGVAGSNVDVVAGGGGVRKGAEAIAPKSDDCHPAGGQRRHSA